MPLRLLVFQRLKRDCFQFFICPICDCRFLFFFFFLVLCVCVCVFVFFRCERVFFNFFCFFFISVKKNLVALLFSNGELVATKTKEQRKQKKQTVFENLSKNSDFVVRPIFFPMPCGFVVVVSLFCVVVKSSPLWYFVFSTS